MFTYLLPETVIKYTYHKHVLIKKLKILPIILKKLKR